VLQQPLCFRFQLDRECADSVVYRLKASDRSCLRPSRQFTILVVEITPISIKSIGHYTYVYSGILNFVMIPLGRSASVERCRELVAKGWGWFCAIYFF
jgi:hypothetical protein